MSDPTEPTEAEKITWSLEDYKEQVPTAMRQETLKIVPAKPDRELAEEIRAKIISVIDPLLAEMSLAKKQGFDVLLGIQTDAQGKSFLQNLKIVKEF